ncbi:YihY/virulence factor BrkB family protein [Microbacterium sp. GXF6406]
MSDSPGPSSEAGRLDAAVERAGDLTRRTLELFPVRVWRHFLQNNGFLLAAGVSYQALFAIFAAIYLAFAIAGIWLGGSPDAVNALIGVINSYIPDLISKDSKFATPEQAHEIARSTTSVLTLTGLVALGAVVWTAIGWVTFSRRAVRDMFGLPPDMRNFIILKARDLLAAVIFGISLIVGAALSYTSAAVLRWVLQMLGWDSGSTSLNLLIRIGTVIVSFAIMTCALAAMVRFLTGTALHWRTIWPGAMLGGGAMTFLQFGVGFLVSYTPSNPLLATFAIFIGLLLWFRVIGVVMLIAAAWIAVTAQDRDQPLLRQSEFQRQEQEYQALVVAARIRLRDATDARSSSPWFRHWSASHAVRSAESELAELLDNPPRQTTPETASPRRLLTELFRGEGGVRAPR